VELVDLDAVPHAVRALWCTGDLWDPHSTKVEVGELKTGGWYARIWDCPSPRIGVRKTCAYAGPDAEHYAWATARRWMRTVGGEWL
jgi:hypothetical protein